MLIVLEQRSQARFRQRQRLLHSLQRFERVCRATVSDHVIPETDFLSQQCLVNPVGMLHGILIFICYSTGLHFYLVTHSIADTLLRPFCTWMVDYGKFPDIS